METVMEIEDSQSSLRTVADLYADPSRYRQMSDKTQEYVRRHYSVDAAWEVIRKILNADKHSPLPVRGALSGG